MEAQARTFALEIRPESLSLFGGPEHRNGGEPEVRTIVRRLGRWVGADSAFAIGVGRNFGVADRAEAGGPSGQRRMLRVMYRHGKQGPSCGTLG